MSENEYIDRYDSGAECYKDYLEVNENAFYLRCLEAKYFPGINAPQASRDYSQLGEPEVSYRYYLGVFKVSRSPLGSFDPAMKINVSGAMHFATSH